MANPNVANSVEHYGLSPREYSSSDYRSTVVARTSINQDYKASEYSGTEFRNYAGIVSVGIGSPIYLPSEPAYNAIAPMFLMPTVNAPYPWEID